MSNATAEKKRMEGVCALWKRTGKNGNVYFTGLTEDRKTQLTAFYNTKKQNLKEPDLRIYVRDNNGKLTKDEFLSLWCNATKNGKKILSGKLNGKRVVGFIKANATEKQPYISIYFEEDKLPVSEEKKPEPKKEEKPKFEEITADAELPF